MIQYFMSPTGVNTIAPYRLGYAGVGILRTRFGKFAHEAQERTRHYQGKQPGAKIESKPAFFFEIIENEVGDLA